MRLNYVARATGSKKRPWSDPSCMKCGKTIAKGDPYQWIQGFRGPKKVICAACRFTRADMTNSKMATVYDAFDAAYAELDEANADSDLQSIVDELANTVREVADEYREAADEYFSGGGPNAEKADEVEACADELESVDVPELTEFAEWAEAEIADDDDRTDEEKQDAWGEWIDEQIAAFRSDIENADSL